MSRFWWLTLCGPVVGRAPFVFYPVASAVGWVAWHMRPTARRNLTRNLLPFCGGDARRARKEGLRAYQNVARYWMDLITLPYRDMSRFEHERLTIVNPERLAVLAGGRPIIAVSAHVGSPEMAVQAVASRGRHYVALVEPLQPPALTALILRLRSAVGGRFYAADFGGLRACVEALRAGGVVGVLGDRDIRGNGVCTSLAGRPVRLPRGPWELARRTRAVVLPVFSTRTRADHFRLYVEEPFEVGQSDDGEADIVAAVQRFGSVLETQLKREPGQWAVLEDFWQVHRCG